jgi:hypothetical protein
MAVTLSSVPGPKNQMTTTLKRNLTLVSPNTHGADVMALQRHLQRHLFYAGDLDGIYGVLTAQAVFKAKYWLGYAEPTQIAGPAFFKFISGAAVPSAEMKRRIAARRREAEVRLTAQQVMAQKAARYLGREEDPEGSNHVPGITDWYRRGAVDYQPWCAIFVSRCAFEAGVDFLYHYCPSIVSDAEQGHNGLSAVKFSQIKTGTISTYDFQGDGVADHAGIVVEELHLQRWVPNRLQEAKREFGHQGPDEFWAIEGNTLTGNDTDGGHVMIRLRKVALVRRFAKAGRLIKT